MHNVNTVTISTKSNKDRNCFAVKKDRRHTQFCKRANQWEKLNQAEYEAREWFRTQSHEQSRCNSARRKRIRCSWGGLQRACRDCRSSRGLCGCGGSRRTAWRSSEVHSGGRQCVMFLMPAYMLELRVRSSTSPARWRAVRIYSISHRTIHIYTSTPWSR